MFLNYKLLLVLLTSFVFSLNTFSQANCAGAAPFCANQGAVSFPAGVGNGSAAAGPDYGCLGSQPNPAWYYFQVSTTGNIVIDIAGTGGFDVDFICWGPFTSATGDCGNLTAGNTVDCSFSASATETCNIASAVSGQYYMLLLTNYSNQTQNITFSQSSGSGSTNCGLLSGSANSQTICAGGTTTLTTTSNLTSPTYVWSNGGTSSSISVSPSSTTIYTVTISGTNPSTGNPGTVVNTSTVTVLPTPTVNLSSNSLICPGSTINLTATTGLASYTWTGPPALNQVTTVGSLSIPNATTNMVGTYTVLVKSAQNCTATATTTVGLIPTASVTTLPSYTVCQGGNLSMTANATGASSYNWSGPSAYTSSVQNPTINPIALNQAGNYTVTASFTSGASTCTTTATSSVIVVAATPAALNPIPTICNNGNINLNAPNGGTTYMWNGPNSFTSSAQNPTISNAAVTNQGTYTVIISTGGCVNTGTVNVSVNTALSITTVPNSIALCQGKVGSLSVGGMGGSGAYNYSWNPTTGLSSANSASTNVTGVSTTNYTVTFSDSNCPITPSQTAAVTVTVNATPVITMTTTNARGCEPFCTDLISTSNPASANCQWSFGNGLGTNACNSPTFCFSNHGSYNAKLIVIDINGCIDSLNQNAFIIVDPKPIPDFDWSPTNPTILINDVSFNDKSTVGLPMTDWEWHFGDNYVPVGTDTSSVKNPIYTYNHVDSYPVTLYVTNSFGCRDSVTKILPIEDEFAIYIPNSFSPTKQDGKNDVFTVAGMGFLQEGFEMAIYDRWGTVIYKTNDVYKGWDGSVKGGGINSMKQDVYIYKIKLKDYRGRSKEFVGHITLL